jgi:hypothetical protein
MWYGMVQQRCTLNWSKIASAATIPDFIAVCEPLILGTLRKPAEQPINAPPGNVNLGTACKPIQHNINTTYIHSWNGREEDELIMNKT